MKIRLLILFCLFNLVCFGQTIKKKDAKYIAKHDTLAHIKKIKSIELTTDFASKILCWVIVEKINLEREYRKVEKAKHHSYMTFIYADKITINANTGVILLREKIKEGSIHFNTSF